MSHMILGSILILLILILFFLASSSSNSDSLSSSVFECGFTSYYYSRFSFSIHYFTIALIFLFLDLELCYLMPFFSNNSPDTKMVSYLWIFIMILVLGLLSEWKYKMLDWKF